MPKVINILIVTFATLSFNCFSDVEIHYDGENIFTPKILDEIQKIADAVDKDVRQYFPNLDEDIFLEVNTSKIVIDETGELGQSIDRNRIRWTVDHERPEGVLAIVKAHLKSTLYHEYHHVARGWAQYMVEEPIRMIDAAVSEGLAVTFERDFGTGDNPWPTHPADIHTWFQEILQVTDLSEYHKWMFRHPDGRRLIGYRVGTYLVDKAMKSSGKSSVDLVDASTDVILEYALK